MKVCQFFNIYLANVQSLEKGINIKMIKMLKELFEHKSLLQELVLRDLKVKYRGSVLGIIWTVLSPLLMMIVMTIMFSGMFASNIEYYPVYYMSGFMIFTLNSEASSDAMYSIIGNASLLKKVYVPKITFPMAKVILAVINSFFTFIAIIIIALIIGSPVTITYLLYPFAALTTAMFSAGLGLLLCSFAVKLRDICYFYSVMLYAWMFMTPLFYPSSSLVGVGAIAIKFNPLYYFVEYSRSAILNGEVPSLENHLFCLFFGITFFIIGAYSFNKKQSSFIYNV